MEVQRWWRGFRWRRCPGRGSACQVWAKARADAEQDLKPDAGVEGQVAGLKAEAGTGARLEYNVVGEPPPLGVPP